MTTKSNESGMEELRRLSRQTANWGQKLQQEEKQKADYEKNVVGVMAGLRGLSFSVALNQLKTVAEPDIYEKVTAMQAKTDSKDLRKLITEISRNLDRSMSRISKGNADLEPLATSSRTLAILISLLFSLQ
jgi:Na+-transporting NADH:ubiquinone oxidoreductase subunit NqrC